MAEVAQYSFIGWMRRGLAGLADAGSVSPAGRLSLGLELEVTGEGDQVHTNTVPRRVSLYGPGDVTGVSGSAIVRTIPRAGVRDFEANFLAAIEFYDEDFPWRYTPQVAQAGRLPPWVWLVVLAEGEFVRAAAPSGKLPLIEIQPPALGSAFPYPGSTWAWAHVQINAGMGPTSVELDEARNTARRLLDENPNLGCSRLVCPRRLAPETHYTGFLIPAFEKGRLAGLGASDREIAEVPNAQPAWPAADQVQSALRFPVYHEWEFSTSSAGDFEALARLLVPVDSSDLEADQLIDIQEPGWGVHYRSERPDREQPGAVALESALRVPGHGSELAFGKDPGDHRLARQLRDLLNLGAEPLTAEGRTSGSNPLFETDAADDPMVVPPLYGSFFRVSRRLSGDPDTGWYEQANLDPVYRAAAGQGAEIVRRNQEEYADRAWDQLRAQLEARSVARRWQFSLHASERFFTRRLDPALSITVDPAATDAEQARSEALMFRVLSLAAPMHAALKFEGGSFAAAIRGTHFGGSYSAGFTKVTRSDGPLMRRLGNGGRVVAPTDTFLNRRIIRTPRASPLQAALAAVLSVLQRPIRRIPPRGLPPDIFDFQDLETTLQQAGLAGVAACRTAFQALQARVQPPSRGVDIFSAANNLLYASLRAQVLPAKTIPPRLRAVLGVAAPATEAEADRIDLAEPSVEFPEPMYRALAERSAGYILPGLEGMPRNSVTMLAPNPAFIEAYLLGLNHEMAREFLWRELPVRLDATFFRQFWDVRDNPDAILSPESFKDILPVRQWPDTALGAADHRPPAMTGDLTVVVVRGDLFRKYPQTEAFLQKAAWAVAPSTQRPYRQADGSSPANIRRPLFSARIAPDLTLLGFQLDADDARGDPNPAAGRPGWYFVLKERAGDVHFGLDLDPSAADPSWPALSEVAFNQCMDVESPEFRALPRFGASPERIAAMLYQRPFAMHVHASRLLSR